MNLTSTPISENFGPKHFVYIEKIGPFQETAQVCWGELHAKSKLTFVEVEKTGAMAIFKMKPQMIYRAGFILDKKPDNLPNGLNYVCLPGSAYTAFTLVGSYSNLGAAWGKTMERVQSLNLGIRDDFFIEQYLNDPAKTSEDKLQTSLMIPTK